MASNMQQRISLQQVAKTIEQLNRHGEQRLRTTTKDLRISPHSPFTIAVSREAGTNGTSIAREVGQRLHWPVYDHELLERVAQEMGIRTSLLERVDERHQTWLQESLTAFMAVPRVNESAYVRNLIETVLALSTHGQCIIVGRGIAHILPAATALRVRLVAPLADRIRATEQRLGVPRNEAAHWVETTERERIKFVRDHFLKDATDPENYDLVLNCARYSPSKCALLVTAALRHLQDQAVEAIVPTG